VITVRTKSQRGGTIVATNPKSVKGIDPDKAISLWS